MQYGSTDAVLHKDLGININAHTAYPNVCYDIVYRHFLMLFFTYPNTCDGSDTLTFFFEIQK